MFGCCKFVDAETGGGAIPVLELFRVYVPPMLGGMTLSGGASWRYLAFLRTPSAHWLCRPLLMHSGTGAARRLDGQLDRPWQGVTYRMLDVLAGRRGMPGVAFFASGLGEVLLSLGLAVQRIAARGSLGLLRVEYHCFPSGFSPSGSGLKSSRSGEASFIFGVRGHDISNPPAGGGREVMFQEPV